MFQEISKEQARVFDQVLGAIPELLELQAETRELAGGMQHEELLDLQAESRNYLIRLQGEPVITGNRGARRDAEAIATTVMMALRASERFSTLQDLHMTEVSSNLGSLLEGRAFEACLKGASL